MLLLILAGSVSSVVAAETQETDQKNGNDRNYIVDLSKGYKEYTGRYSESQFTAFVVTMSLKNVKYSSTIVGMNPIEMDLDGDGTYDVMARGTGYPSDSEGGPEVWMYIPCSGGSITGSYTCTIGENLYNPNYPYFSESLKDYDSVTFIFPEEPVRNMYAISIENGKAYVNGKEASQAAPGDNVRIFPEAVAGEYVSCWKSDLIGSVTRFTDACFFHDTATFFMPASDVSLKAEMKKQQPVSFDMSKGYCLAHGGPGTEPTIWDIDIDWANDFGVPFYNKISSEADLDGDGTDDICCYIVDGNHPMISPYVCFVYFIPLSTSSIRGTYTTQGTSISPYWPYTFVFPSDPVKSTYPITVDGGRAVNSNGQTVTEAYPGQRLKLVSIGDVPAAGFECRPEYKNIAEGFLFGYVREINPYEIVMPACELTYTKIPKEGETLEITFHDNMAFLPNEVANYLIDNNSEIEPLTEWYRSYGPQREKGVLWFNYPSDYQPSLTLTLPNPIRIPESEKVYTAVSVIIEGNRDIYPITCTDDEIMVYFGNPESDTSRIIGCSAGYRLFVDKSGLHEPEGYCFIGFEAKDFRMDYVNGRWQFEMPDHAIELKPVFQKVDTTQQTPLLIDLSDGMADVSDSEVWKSIERAGIRMNYDGDLYDLNGDGQWDVKTDNLGKRMKRLADYSCGESFTINTGNHGQKYFPITFVNNPKEAVEPGSTPAVTPGTKEEQKNESSDTPAKTSQKPASKSRKGGAVLWVLIILAAVLAFGGGMAYCVIRNRKEEAQKALRREKMLQRRAAEAAETVEPQEEEVSGQTEEQNEPKQEEDEDYL